MNTLPAWSDQSEKNNNLSCSSVQYGISFESIEAMTSTMRGSKFRPTKRTIFWPSIIVPTMMLISTLPLEWGSAQNSQRQLASLEGAGEH